MPPGSYDPEAGHLDLAAELHRLEAQVDLSWAQEERLLHALGLGEAADVLEVGCGPGFVTERLLSCNPRASVTAIDPRAELLNLARERVRHLGDGVRIVATSVTDAGLDAGTFDFVLARLVFQHLDDPLAAAVEINRVLRPGGVVAVIDVDRALWGLADPSTPGLDAIWQRAGRLQTDRGGDQVIARRLWRVLRHAGFVDLRLDAFVCHSDEVGLAAFTHQLEPDRLLPAVVAGHVSVSDYARARMAFDDFCRDPDAFVLMVGFIASGRRSESSE